jgi:hypothetical protein
MLSQQGAKMRQKSEPEKPPAEDAIKDIRRATRRPRRRSAFEALATQQQPDVRAHGVPGLQFSRTFHGPGAGAFRVPWV